MKRNEVLGWVNIRYMLALLLLGSPILATGVVFWLQDAAPASQQALESYQSDGQVWVTEENGLVTLELAEGSKPTGFIFYPGSRVDYRAYSPLLKLIAAKGYLVVLVPMPLNLAFLNTNAADQILVEYPDIDHWAIGGHSLGGVAAADYAARHPAIEGLVLWASYPASASLAHKEVKVLGIYGSEDGLTHPEKVIASRTLLPPDSLLVEISGGNHAQFGSYGFQDGDKPAYISPEQQWTEVAEATSVFLDSLSK